jgi:hypothetical protein
MGWVARRMHYSAMISLEQNRGREGLGKRTLSVMCICTLQEDSCQQ